MTFLTTPETAEFLKTTNAVLRNSRSTGKLWSHEAPKYVQIGRKILYKKSTLDEWLSQFGELASTSQKNGGAA
ncbi:MULTISPECIES: helix-turn-helix domain-containing protein [Cysteiniphilum]|uniref:Helix-turn-helix domain-containing protein n=1 Tax=Cysteiniphilum litorale TaxID=2056700 RepID=A0A8J2Z5X1_9GAMM|nr:MULTISPECIES: helix-turn-helix domain-containing protein [Cysteiniphilum]GGG04027.1 hypothetical protein GCM10010995_21900 [Cysteiniphilum litorale]